MNYSRWDAAAQAHQAAEGQRSNEAARIFNSDGAFDPAATRAGLAEVDAPVLLLAGDLDWIIPPAAAADFAGVFRTRSSSSSPAPAITRGWTTRLNS